MLHNKFKCLAKNTNPNQTLSRSVSAPGRSGSLPSARALKVLSSGSVSQSLATAAGDRSEQEGQAGVPMPMAARFSVAKCMCAAEWMSHVFLSHADLFEDSSQQIWQLSSQAPADNATKGFLPGPGSRDWRSSGSQSFVNGLRWAASFDQQGTVPNGSL